MRDVKLWAHRESAPGHLRFIRTAPAEAGRRRGERDPGSRQRRFVRQRGLDRRKSSKAWRFSKTAGRKRLLQSLRQTLKRHYGDRLLPIDVETCRMWGELTAAAQKAGRNIPAPTV